MTTDPSTTPTGETVGPRDRMVRGAVESIRERGVTATGMRDVVDRAQAPRGSLQHYFPGGKEQLVREAVAWAGEVAARRIRRRLDDGTLTSPSDLFEAMVDNWRRAFLETGFGAGCPLLAAAADVAADSEGLRTAIGRAFDEWQAPVRQGLEQLGVPRARTASLAILMMSTLEGAIVISRTHLDVEALDAVSRELAPLLDSAVDSAAGPS